MQTSPKLLYVVTEDWFFCSHFLPMARGAQAAGFQVTVACRVREKGEVLRGEGFRVVPVEVERGDRGLGSLSSNVKSLAAVFRREKPDIVHFISLRPVLLGGLLARLMGLKRVFAVTGLGPLNGPTSLRRVLAMATVRVLLRAMAGRGARFLFENRDDPRRLGLDVDDPGTVCVVGGAGVDERAFHPTPEPPAPPLKVATVARMLWTKGIDAAVAAVEDARARGSDVELSLFGMPDPSNPAAIPDDVLRDWSARPGIVWHGATTDVAQVWRTHHVALLPSHGEGMPRMLVEAAACGRPMVATDVSGCRTLVSPGTSGFLVSVGDSAGIADALVRLARDPGLRDRMGTAARATVLSGYTETQVAADVVSLYRGLLQQDAGTRAGSPPAAA